MSNNIVLPLKRAKEIERERTWEDLDTPQKLLKWIVEHMGVDASAIVNTFPVTSSDDDTQENCNGATHINTSKCSITIGGCTIHKYPVGIVMRWISTDVVAGIVELTEEERIEFGLPDPEGKYQWVEYRP